MVKSGQHAFTLLYPFFLPCSKWVHHFHDPPFFWKSLNYCGLYSYFYFLNRGLFHYHTVWYSETYIGIIASSFFFFFAAGITKLTMPPAYKLKGSKSWRILLFIILDIDDTNEFKYIIISRAPMVNK